MQRLFDTLWTPQMAAAALIVSASVLLISSRFGSVSGMVAQAGSRAEILVNQGQRKFNQTEAMARTGFRRVSYEVNTLLFDGNLSEAETGRRQPDEHRPADPARGKSGTEKSRRPTGDNQLNERQHHRD